MKNWRKILIGLACVTATFGMAVAFVSCGESNSATSSSTQSIQEVLHEHSWQYYEIQEQTCEQEGIFIKICNCGQEERENKPARGHNLTTVEAQAATCETDGWEEYKECLDCNYQEGIVVLEKTGHDFQNCSCINCQEDLIEYVVSENGEYAICLGLKEKFADEETYYETIVVADEYEGLPVEEVAPFAFAYIAEEIPWFESCDGVCEDNIRKIKNMTLGENLKRIGEKAFYRCSLSALTIPDSVESIGAYAFAGVLLDHVGCFSNPNRMVSLDLGSVKTIGDYAFFLCTELKEIVIPDTVESIGAGAFSSDCTGVADGLGNFTNLEKVVIGNSVKTIGERAFYRNMKLTEVVIPDSVESIGKEAFGTIIWYEIGMSSLTKVTIGKNVKSIGENVFSDCTALTTIVYHGTAEEWAAISIHENNEILFSIEITYQD